MNKKNKMKKGSTLIEALALLTLFSIATLAFYKMYTESIVLISEAKRRLIAVELAAERMEQLRNVPYDELIDTGTVGGQIERDDITTVNNVVFRIITHINSIDDPIDGLTSTTDINGNDYKRIKVFVLWSKGADSGVVEADAIGNDYDKYRIELTSTFIPPAGFEGTNAEYGVLSINVVDSEGAPIDGATVDISCNECSTDAGTADYTSSETTVDGNVTISVPPSYFGSEDVENYEITITKLDYQTTKTYKRYDGTAAHIYEPLNTHLTVQRGRRTVETFVMDEVHDFPLQVKDPYCKDIAGAYQVNFEGGRIVGTDPSKTPNETLYDLDDFFTNTTFTTDATGAVDIQTDTDLSGGIDVSDEASDGVYEVDITDFETNNPSLTFWKMIPNNGYDRNKLYLGGDTSCNFIAMDKSVDSLQVIVKDSNTGLPLENASVRVQNTVLGYVASEETDEFGRTYFPNDKNVPLVQAVYEVRISISGYSTYNETIDTTSGGLIGLTKNMTP